MIFIDTELGRYVRSPFTAALAISFLAMPAFAQKRDEQLWIEINASTVLEPHRVCRRRWVVSHAAISMLSAAA